MPKGSQNDAKMDAQINRFSYFFKKYEKYEIKPPLRREHDFTGSRCLRTRKSRFKRYTKSMSEKAMQKVSKMRPKLKPNGGQDHLKIQKNVKKGMPKIDAEKLCRKNARF